MTNRFPFPNPANETSARLVAGGVVLLGLAYVLSGSIWLAIALTYGFVARVIAGPTFSPLAILVTKVITPRLNISHKFVPGPPKRFAQFLGLAFSSSALFLTISDNLVAARIVIGALVCAATLESVFAICLGCITFSRLMQFGLVPKQVCENCVIRPSSAV